MNRHLTSSRASFTLPVVVAVLFQVTASVASADPYVGLHSFTGLDGSVPVGPLLQVGSELWGTTLDGGGDGVDGVLFSINPDGSNYQIRHGFAGIAGDGVSPSQGVVQSGSKLYGMTTGTVSSNLIPATIYSINTDGSGYQTIHTLSDFAGELSTSLTAVGTRLYGLEAYIFGGQPQKAFSLNLDGSDFQYLHTFVPGTDGGHSNGRMIALGSTLYGTTSSFGPTNGGTVFSMNLDGSNFQVLHSFIDTQGGGGPWGGLTLVGSVLYGTTHFGLGTGGSVFSMNLDGSNFQTLHTFSMATPGPIGDLIESNSVLYGTTLGIFGTGSNGSVYSMNLDGSNFKILTEFAVPTGPTNPSALSIIGSTLFGTTTGVNSKATSPDRFGTVFAIPIPEPTGFALAAMALAGFSTVAVRRQQRGR